MEIWDVRSMVRTRLVETPEDVTCLSIHHLRLDLPGRRKGLRLHLGFFNQGRLITLVGHEDQVTGVTFSARRATELRPHRKT